jgi:predicted O-methyltransferase YrrM
MKTNIILMACMSVFACICTPLEAQPTIQDATIDGRVKAFLESHSGKWHDMNVPASDGKVLYDIILKNNYKNALEIGTSTGHSAIWIAWALNKTGGKLITIEIDEDRHKIALANFKEAGLSDYIDARLADAHTLVPQLDGPFDFIFSDADKEWYKKYFIAISPKLRIGGCFTAHNVWETRGYENVSGTAEFYNYIRKLPSYETTVIETGNGLSVSYKKSD